MLKFRIIPQSPDYNTLQCFVLDVCILVLERVGIYGFDILSVGESEMCVNVRHQYTIWIVYNKFRTIHLCEEQCYSMILSLISSHSSNVLLASG